MATAKRTLELKVAVFQGGVLQVEKTWKPRPWGHSIISWGSHKKTDLWIPFSKIPPKFSLFSISPNGFVLLLDPRFEGFVNLQGHYAEIQELIWPKKALRPLAMAGDPLQIDLGPGSRGRLTHMGFDVVFRVGWAQPVQKAPSPFPKMGKAPFAPLPFTDPWEGRLTGAAFAAAACAFVPMLFWLTSAPIPVGDTLEHIPEAKLVSIIDGSWIRYQPFVYDADFDPKLSFRYALQLITFLQNRWEGKSADPLKSPPPPLLEGLPPALPLGTHNHDLKGLRLAMRADSFFEGLDLMLQMQKEQRKSEAEREGMSLGEGLFALPVDYPTPHPGPASDWGEEMAQFQAAEALASASRVEEWARPLALERKRQTLQTIALVEPLAPLENVDWGTWLESLDPQRKKTPTPPPPPPKPYVSMGDVEKILFANRGDVTSCYLAALRRNPTLKGTVEWQWTITPKGTGVDFSRRRADFEDGRLFACVESHMTQWKFPFPQNGAVSVRYPFTFLPGPSEPP